MSLAEEVAAGVANAAGPIADHLVASVAKQIGIGVENLKSALSGKKIHIECDITIPDLTKNA